MMDAKPGGVPTAAESGCPPPLDKRPARIAEMFDAIAGRYDLLNHLLTAGLDSAWRRRAIASLRLAGGETILDLCTGTADVALAAARSARRPALVLGVDFAGEMLRLARRKIQSGRAATRIALIRGDATGIPLRSESVDAVTVAFGIRNVQRPDRAFTEIHRVLRVGGRLAMLEFGMPRARSVRRVYPWYFRRVLPGLGRLISGHPTAYTYLPVSVGQFTPPEQLVDMLRASGFSNVGADPLTLGIVYLYSAQK
jgi:demethylmenaquinone methyltransferase / 2-methoxy-6-polyprenyl-1,4-benzoquinol methylase